MFIVLEGIDGSGKTTQAKLLADWLGSLGFEVCLTSEPTDGKIGKLVKQIVRCSKTIDPRTLALLFTADRYEHIRQAITPALEEGKVVISERYYYSTYAYQAAQGVDETWLRSLNAFAAKPNLAFLLDISAKQALRRKKPSDIFERDLGLLERVRQNYLRLGLVRIDASRSVEVVQEEVRGVVRQKMGLR